MSSTPGILHVLADPGPNVSENEFHDWYNNEHGPDRMRLSQIRSGLRYQATDGLSPPWLATYELDDINFLQNPAYTYLRENRTPREVDLVSRIAVLDRHIYRLIVSVGQFNPQADSVAMTVSLVVPAASSSDLEQWYIKEHITMLSRIPGWQRSRLHKEIEKPSSDVASYIAIHEFSQLNGLRGAEHQAAMDTPWRTRIMSSLVENGRCRREFRLHRILSKLPNDLAHPLSDAPRIIDSFHPRDDGSKIHYRLEGSPTGPVIVFCNSLLTDLHIWDYIIPHVLPYYQVLRYDARGHGLSTSNTIRTKVSDLSADLLGLLCALNIVHVYALIGVSLGGVTALDFALQHPSHLSRLVAADCSISSTPANTSAWKARIALARSSQSGHAELARQTIARWFIPSQLDSSGAKAVERMILTTTLPGFEGGAQALCDFDLRDVLPGLQVPALFVAGEKDGTLPDAMRSFSVTVPDASFSVIANAGHLSMVENPDAFWETISEFLRSDII